MKTLSNFYRLSFLSLVLLLSFSSCTEDDDDNAKPSTNTQSSTSTVSIADSLVSFEASGVVNFTFESEIDYTIANNNNIKYLIISSEADIDGDTWRLSIEQYSNDSISLPSPGEYDIIQGVTNTIGTTSFNARIANDNGMYFGGNNNEVNGKLTVVSNDGEILKAKFSFEALNDNAEQITVSKGEFSAVEDGW